MAPFNDAGLLSLGRISFFCLSVSLMTSDWRRHPVFRVSLSLSVWPWTLLAQVICPVALLSMFSLRSRSLRRGFVPVCGCKITTVFIPPQVFLCFTASFSEILSATSFQSIESTNVKICLTMLIAKLLPSFFRYYLCVLSQNKYEFLIFQSSRTPISAH